jgi:hypothetical protein
VTRRLWRVAILTAAGAIGTASNAEAALYYWSDSDGGISRPMPPASQRRQPSRRHQAKKPEAPEKESSKPQGPLIIAISIERQKLRVYDANGFYAETPISTGMKGHPTPMGVFSIIQKHKLHHSNIYSGAPMPFMQRITWSGVAMHAGVLPGYPASHGCIRMPMAFAMKMWNWTKMGARVVVTPGEMTPSSFSHPLLVAQKVAPQPADQPQADTPPATKGDKASNADTPVKPAISEANLELRSTVGHHDDKPVMSEPSAPVPLREPTRTADASNALPATKTLVTMSDAASTGGKAPPREEAVEQAVSAKAGDASKAEVKSEEAVKTQAEPTTAEHHETVSSDEKPVEAKSPEAAAETKSAETEPAETKSAETKSAETETADKAEKKPDEAAVAVQTGSDTVTRTEASAAESPKADAAKVEAEKVETRTVEARPEDVKTEAAISDTQKPVEKSDDQVKPVTDTAAIPEVKKDQARPAEIEKAVVARPSPAIVAAPKRTGQIAVFVSRKDSKLYVRQNFAPLFEVPVTIAPSDRPLGTHVFTAQVDKDDANVLHWSVVSLPVPSRYAERRDEDERVSRKRKMTGAAEMKPLPVPDSPAEALDRLTIPADAMARITEALTTGGSIIVSDQGINAGETGEGTDFIVSLR